MFLKMGGTLLEFLEWDLNYMKILIFVKFVATKMYDKLFIIKIQYVPRNKEGLQGNS